MVFLIQLFRKCPIYFLPSAIPQPNRRPYRPGSRPGNRPGGSTSQLGGFSVECGISDNLPDSLLSNFIVGGQFAEEGDVPWQVNSNVPSFLIKS